MKKKILIFSLAYYPKHVGGAEIAMKEITDRISPSEYEFHMVTNRYDRALPKREQYANMLVHRIGPAFLHVGMSETHRPYFYLAKILYVPLAAARACRLHREHHFDGFWAMMLYMTFPITLLRLVGIRVPYLLTLQEGDPYERVFERWRIRLVKPLLLQGIKKAAVVQTISHYLAGWVAESGYTGPTHVVPNGVDVAYFAQRYSNDSLQEAKKELNKKEHDVFLVTTSRLVYKNGLDDVIRALAALPQNVHFIVYGSGPEKESLTRLSHEVNAKERVHFLGHIDRTVMPRYLQACDIFIRPSRSEGMGNSFIEAMAAGLPVVATQEGGIRDFLFDEKKDPGIETTGWAVEKDSPHEIARAVEEILDDSVKVGQVRRAARRMVEKKYDWNLIAERMHHEVFDPLFQ